MVYVLEPLVWMCGGLKQKTYASPDFPVSLSYSIVYVYRTSFFLAMELVVTAEEQQQLNLLQMDYFVLRAFDPVSRKDTELYLL